MLVLVGWVADLPSLKSLVPMLPATKPSTAACIVLLGAGLCFRNDLRLAAFCAGTAALLAAAALTGASLGWDVALGAWLDRTAEPAAQPEPHPMAPVSAMCICFLGAGVVLDGAGRASASQLLGAAAALLSGIALVGYLYDARSLYTMNAFSPMALPAAIALFVASIGVSFSSPRKGLVAMLGADSIAGVAARRLLPLVVLMPVALGGLQLVGLRQRWYEPSIGTTLLVVSTVVVLMGLVFLHAGKLHSLSEARERADAALARANERYRSIFENAPQGMFQCRANGVLVAANPALARILGYDSPEALLADAGSGGVAVAERSHVAHALAELAQRREAVDLETTLPRRDGTRVWVSIALRVVAGGDAPEDLLEGSVEDISRRRSLEDQLLHAQKMEAIGLLAGGIAHDFNNMLTAINGYSELLLDRMQPGQPMRRELEEVHEAGTRAALLTQQLLVFGRKHVVQPVELDVDQAVREAQRLLARLIGEDVRLSVQAGAGGTKVLADPGQIAQILMNLSINARDAMPGGGDLTIETATVDLDEAYAAEHLDTLPGKYVMISVSDTGVGMDPETSRRVFEPFFTTKPVGRGTGLGLSTVYSIVSQAGGSIRLRTEKGRGTTFSIFLPAAPASKVSEVTTARDLGPPSAPATVMLVEDEHVVRRFVDRVLVSEGHLVLPADSPERAIALAAEHPRSIDLLVTDVVMPGMSGRDLLRELERSQPDMLVLYISGYSANGIVHHGVLDPGTPFLQKPLSAEGLRRKVRAVLADR